MYWELTNFAMDTDAIEMYKFKNDKGSQMLQEDSNSLCVYM